MVPVRMVAMGRRREEEKAAPTCKHGKPTLFSRSTEDVGFDSKLGELPLFYVTSQKLTKGRPVGRSHKIAISPHHFAKGKSDGHGRCEVSADVHLWEGNAGWPPSSSHDSQEIATWAGSFRFELGAHDADWNSTNNQDLTETPGGSFRFRNGTEELSEDLRHWSHLKLPQQLENNHGSNSYAAIAATANEAELQSTDYGDKVPSKARHNVAVDVPNSPERDEVLRRLRMLKAARPSATPSLLRFGLDDVTSSSLLRFGSSNLDDVVSHHEKMAKLTARRDHLHQRLKNDPCKSSFASPLSKSSSTPTLIVGKKIMVPSQSQETINTLGELEIMPRVQRNSASSGILGSPCRTAPQSATQELHPTTPTTSRFKQSSRRSSSRQDQIVSIRKLQFPARAASNASNVSSPDHTPFMSAASGRIPFKWEEEPGKPKVTIADAHAHRLSQEEIEVSNCKETILQLDSSQQADENIVPDSAMVVEASENGKAPARSSPDGAGDGNGDGERIESHRYYGRGHWQELSLGQSSRRTSTHERLEAQIDLDASAAARFLVELYDTPMSTPGRHSSSPMFAVPFKWEDAPGKAKVEISVGRSNMLQLPPRLTVPSHRSAESFSRDLRASHSFAGFLPCLTAWSPGQQQRKHMLVQYGSSKSLPPRAPSSPSPPERGRKRHGLVGRCYSTPKEGCQIVVSKSTAGSPVLRAVSGNLFSEETKNSRGSLSKKDNNPNAPSSPRSILCGPDEGSNSQTSASNVFSSGDLEDFTQQTNHSGQSASKSSNTSFESVEEDFAELPSPASSNLHPLHSGEPQAPPKETSPHGPQEPPHAMDVSLPNLSRIEKQKQRQETTHSSEPAAWSPALAKYFQSLEQDTSTSAGAPTASGCPNSCEEELPLAPKPALPTIQPLLLQQQQPQETNWSAQASPKRPTRLPYTMPSLADQLRASRDNFIRRQLIHDLSPRLPRQYSERRPSRSSHGDNSGAKSLAPRVKRYQADEVCQPSPAYAAALQLLSPPGDLTTQRQRKGLAKLPLPKPLAAKPRRRARFMISICRTLKRLVLGRPRRCKPKLMYDYAMAPTSFQLYQVN